MGDKQMKIVSFFVETTSRKWWVTFPLPLLPVVLSFTLFSQAWPEGVQ